MYFIKDVISYGYSNCWKLQDVSKVILKTLWMDSSHQTRRKERKKEKKVYKNYLLSIEPWTAAKKLSVSVAVPPAPVRVPSQRPLASSVASVTSVANDKGDNEMVRGAVHRSPGICLTAEENPRKPQLGEATTIDYLHFFKIITKYTS